MKAKPSALTLRTPMELKSRIERIAFEQGVSINQLALYAFT
jgi:predicted HicB family RNase H-like nuclease